MVALGGRSVTFELRTPATSPGFTMASIDPTQDLQSRMKCSEKTRGSLEGLETSRTHAQVMPSTTNVESIHPDDALAGRAVRVSTI